jgi:hypothetical protein
MLTATMTIQVRDEVVKLLHMPNYVVAWAPTLRMDCTLRFWEKRDGDHQRLLEFIDELEGAVHSLVFSRQESTMNYLWWEYLADRPSSKWIDADAGVDKRTATHAMKMAAKRKVSESKPKRKSSAFGRSLRRRTIKSGVRGSIGESVQRLENLVEALTVQKFYSNAPATDSALLGILSDLARELGRIRLVFATIGIYRYIYCSYDCVLLQMFVCVCPSSGCRR